MFKSSPLPSKIFSLVVALPFAISLAFAEEFRDWTKAETEQVISAKIVGKRIDNTGVHLRLKNGRAYWVEAKDLIEADREFIKAWVKPVDHIQTRVVSSGKGYKVVEITAEAGNKDLLIKAYWDEGDSHSKKYRLKKGEMRTFTYRAGHKYRVEALAGDEVVDAEKWNKKTGL